MIIYKVDDEYYDSIDDYYYNLIDLYHNNSSYASGNVVRLVYKSDESNLKKRNINRVEPVGILHWICLFFGGKL